MKNRYTRLASETFIFAIGNLLVRLIQFFLLPLYTTAMTAKSYAVAELISNMSDMALPLFSLCLYEAVLRFAIDVDIDKKELFSTSLNILIFNTCIILFATYILSTCFSYAYLWYFSTVLISAILRTFFACFVKGIGKLKNYVLSSIINVTVLFLCNIVLLSYYRSEVRGFLLSIVISNIVTILYLFFCLDIRHYMNFKVLNILLLRKLLGYSLPLIFSTLIWLLINVSGRFIILYFYSQSAAGFYTAASKLPAIINMATGVFQQAWLLTASREAHSGSAGEFFSDVFKFISSGMILFTSFIICLTPFISKLMLRGEFYEARIYLPSLIFVALLNFYSTFFGTFYFAYKNNKMIVVSSLLGAICNVLVSLLFIKFCGAWACISGSFVCLLVMAVMRIMDTRRFVSIKKAWTINLISIFIVVIQVILMSLKIKNGIVLSSLLLAGLILFNICHYKKELAYLIIKIGGKMVHENKV